MWGYCELLLVYLELPLLCMLGLHALPVSPETHTFSYNWCLQVVLCVYMSSYGLASLSDCIPGLWPPVTLFWTCA